MALSVGEVGESTDGYTYKRLQHISSQQLKKKRWPLWPLQLLNCTFFKLLQDLLEIYFQHNSGTISDHDIRNGCTFV